MQLKGLVKFFAAALILLSLWQLSHTWFVRSFEKGLQEKAEKTVKASMMPAAAKYPTNKDSQEIYQVAINQAIATRYRRLIDSNAATGVTWWNTPYSVAKDRELKLGLDLQGGMNVTLEVGLEGVIRSKAANSKDPIFNAALSQAVTEKANGSADLIGLFAKAYKQKAPNNKLAPLFIANSNKVITFNSSDDEVISYLQKEAGIAFKNTSNILQTRIDQFGVASPTINPDASKSVITIELAGVTDKERVRKYLQSSANLQFFELYNLGEVYKEMQDVQPVLKDYIKGVSITDSGYNEQAVIDSFNKKMADTTNVKNQKKGDNPMFDLFQGLGQPYQDQTGKQKFPSEVAYVAIKDTAQLGDYLRLPFVASKFPANLRFAYGYAGNDDLKPKGILGLYALKMPDASGVAFLEGSAISDSRQDYTQDGKVCVSMSMTKEGERKWASMTEKNIGKPVAIVLDNFVRSAPNVNEKISGGNSQISGGFDKNVQEAQDLADILKSGPLDAPAKIVQEQVVGATLGEDAVKGGQMSFVISFLIIFILMLIYYNTSGWVANASLILNLLFTIGILASLGATLTAAGIAALVLTIGMAVDTNVIIFERIKEELTMGKSYQAAVNTGYRRSLAPVLDSHVTTFLTAAILFYFGLGPVRGFATTQMIGILLNLFCGILVSRLITEWFTNKQKHLTYFTGISKKIFAHAQFKFIEFRKVAYGISVVVLLAGVGAIINGFDQGVEFKGGRSYTVQFPATQKLNTTEIADALKPVFGELPIVKTVGTNNQLDITTSFMKDATAKNADSIVERTLYSGLSRYIPAGTSYQDFDSNLKVGSQTVLPTISGELKRGAAIATIVSIFVICLYIFIRFRDWRYSLGTIVSLLHDVLVTLAVFSFARRIVPFPLEIDQHFIAAILTVIGFSMNDTIIVFDRIRENSHSMIGADRGLIINKSINQTLSRTIMTSLTVFLTLLILFIFGGEVTKGFAFAMLIGVITGTYSSIFVAAPILVDFGGKKPLGGEHHAKKDPYAASKKKIA
ncbi:MAG: protein translocase subunit SecDF [Chitinophagaceae bacterium]